jgi:phospholipid/cholesterol/gamma-HCH transport system substrate-binding protein
MRRHIPNRSAVIGLVVSVVVVAVMVANFGGMLSNLFSSDGSRLVKATFITTQQLHTGDLVRMDGMDVGKVDGIALDRGGRSSTVTLRLKDDAGRLYADARAQLRFRLLLGSSFYVRLQRGSAESGPLGSSPIPTSRTSTQVEFDDISSVIAGNSRKGLRTMLAETSRALSGRTPLRSASKALADASPSLATATGALRGRDRDRDLEALVRNASNAVQALDAPDRGLQSLVSHTGQVVGVTARRGEDLAALLADAPSTMAQIRQTFADVRQTLDRVDPLVSRLNPEAPAVAPTLASLRTTAGRGADLLGRARPLVKALRPAVGALGHTARGGVPLLQALDPTLRRLEQTVLPKLNERDRATQLTTAEAIGPFFAAFGQAGGQMDQIGHFIRFPASAGNASVYLPCQTYFNNPDKAKAIECKSLQESFDALLSYDPFKPVPGVDGEPPKP